MRLDVPNDLPSHRIYLISTLAHVRATIVRNRGERVRKKIVRRMFRFIVGFCEICTPQFV